MDSSFQQIADLFQLTLPEDSGADPKAVPRKTKGDDAAESAELGRHCLSQGDFQGAIKHFETAAEQGRAEDPELAVDLAAAYEYGDEGPLAFRQYLRARRLGASTDPLVGISELLKRNGRYRDSIEKLAEAIEADPANAHLRFKLAETLSAAGERKRALEAGRAAVAAKPEDAFYHFWVGDLLLSMNRDEEALESFRAAIELSPGDDYLLLRASIAFWKLDRKPEAIKAIRLASDLDPKKDLYHGLLEALLSDMGQLDEANLESDRADKMDRYDEDLMDRVLKEMGLQSAL